MYSPDVMMDHVFPSGVQIPTHAITTPMQVVMTALAPSRAAPIQKHATLANSQAATTDRVFTSVALISMHVITIQVLVVTTALAYTPAAQM
jgi:hypothetical protein